MGLEATWSLVDIPSDARDAAQSAARREGLSVGEWLTRRILRRFSELNAREQEDTFVALRNHVAELSDRLDRFEGQARAEPMREALKKLHQGLTRLNEELVRTAGHSAIQISELSGTVDTLGAKVEDLRTHGTQNRGAFERRMAQLQEFVDGLNLRQSAETRTLVSKMDSLNDAVAESRQQSTTDKGALERLERSLATSDAQNKDTSRTLNEKLEVLSDRIGNVCAAGADSSAVLDQRIASLQQEFGGLETRRREDALGANGKFEILSGKLDELNADSTGMCGALDRRLLLVQQNLQSLDSRYAETAQTLSRSVGTVTTQITSLRADSVQTTSSLDRRVAELQKSLQEIDGRQKSASQTLLDTRNRQASTASAILKVEESVKALDARVSETGSQIGKFDARLQTETEKRQQAIDELRANLLEQTLNVLGEKLETESHKQRAAIGELRATLLDQTLTALGGKLETEGLKQQAAIAELKSGLLSELAQAFDERVEADERKQQEAATQLQTSFAAALQSLGESFDRQAQKQQDAIAELKQSLFPHEAPAPQPPDVSVDEGSAHESPLNSYQEFHHESDVSVVATATMVAPQMAVEHEEPVLELTTPVDPLPMHAAAFEDRSEDTLQNAVFEDPSEHTPQTDAFEDQPEHIPQATSFENQSEPVPHVAAFEDQSEDTPQAAVFEDQSEHVLQTAAAEPPPFPAESAEHPVFDVPVFGDVEHLAPAGVLARNDATDPLQPTGSYLSAARQSLQAAAARSDTEGNGKDFFGLRFLRSLSLPGKEKGQTTSYALIAGIALVAILAIAVTAGELMQQSTPLPQVRAIAPHPATVSKPSRAAAKPVSTRTIVPSRAPSNFTAEDRASALAKGGDAHAQLLVGLRELAKENNAEAATWLERAAIQGIPVAQYRIATLYASGRGVPADKVKAFRWYLAAAQAGNRKAMSNLAVAYAQGDGVQKNPQEAGRWFLKAAQLGLGDAQFDLAILYERGLGVPQNLTDAYRWYVIAAKSGDKESKDRVDALSSQLTSEDRAAAETAAAEFKPLPTDARANEPQ